MKVINYKGIIFDDYEEDEYGIWAEMCHECAEEHHNLVSKELDDGGTARGVCSVKGCFNSGESDEKMHYYIDFDPELVKYEEGSIDDAYDEQYI